MSAYHNITCVILYLEDRQVLIQWEKLGGKREAAI